MRTHKAVALRLRLTLAFAASMAVVLAGLAVFLYARLGTDLQNNIDLGLRARAGAIAAALKDRDPAPVDAARSVIDPDESFAQVLTTSGVMVAPAYSHVQVYPLLSAPDLRAVTGPTFFTKHVPKVDDLSRLLAVPVQVHGQHLVVVVGTNLGDKNDALHRLLLLLAIGIPAAILLASAIGWLVAGAALRPLDAALDAERRFIDEASHDLRTPLGVLKAELDLALLRPRTADELEGTVRTAAEQTDHLVRLAEDLLVHARTRRGPVPVHREAVRLPAFCADAAASFQALGKPVAVDAPDGVVHVDPVLLRQAVRNLLDNAFAHGGGADVTLRAECVDHRLAVSVSDAGPGPPPGLPRLLTRADSAEHGLGLSIVAAVAEAHGGSARIEDRSPTGTVATIDVPNGAAPG
jgi:signal transduction histidine kinase